MSISAELDENMPFKNSSESSTRSLSHDERLNALLNTVIVEVKHFAEDQIKHINELTEIGLALSAEKNINKLLEFIVDKARALSNCDAGTLYILDRENDQLRFEILQNDTLNTRMGGTSGVDITLPGVPLHVDNNANYFNVSSYAALTGEIINIPDVYEAEGFDFKGTRQYDQASGYRSKSMLVIPMRNHENDIIGVLQLLNATHPQTGEVIAFPKGAKDLIASLASQAAVALTNTQLIRNLKDLFSAFIRSIATAIDEKSPYTGGHIRRVVDLTMMIAEEINGADCGPFKDCQLSNDEIEALRLAAWMHDVGKITTPEYIVDKGTKLQTICDRIDHVETKFQLIAQTLENEYQRKKIELLQNQSIDTCLLDELDTELAERLETLKDELEFLRRCNLPDEFMSDDKIDRLLAIASKNFTVDGTAHPYLTHDEVKNLSIRKGSLTSEERKIIENHADMTLRILKEIPFSGSMADVPEYAAGHHEKLDGTGYPRGLCGSDLPLQARIMAIADIFEALTARDRPYKKPMKLSQALKIMGFMKSDNHIDPDIFDLFIQQGLYINYARREMNPDQIDLDDKN